MQGTIAGIAFTWIWMTKINMANAIAVKKRNTTHPVTKRAEVSSKEIKFNIVFEVKMSNFIISGDTLVKYNGKEPFVNIPESVRHIGERAFSHNQYIQVVIFPSNLVSIGSYAFEYCKELYGMTFATVNLQKNTSGEHYRFPNSLRYIGAGAFYQCSALGGAITIPDGVKEIKENTFSGCCSITSIVFPNVIDRIGDYAFVDCSEVFSVTWPSSLRIIERYAFSYCKKLFAVRIPADIVSVDDSAFYMSTGVEAYSGPSKYEVFFPKVLREKDEKNEKPIMICLVLALVALFSSATIPVLPAILAAAVLYHIIMKISTVTNKSGYLKAAVICAILAVIFNVVRSIQMISYSL